MLQHDSVFTQTAASSALIFMFTLKYHSISINYQIIIFMRAENNTVYMYLYTPKQHVAEYP